MKSIIFIAIVILTVTINCSRNLKINQEVLTVEKSVDPKMVKSLGEFSNISPDASKVITPKYASKY